MVENQYVKNVCSEVLQKPLARVSKQTLLSVLAEHAVIVSLVSDWRRESVATFVADLSEQWCSYAMDPRVSDTWESPHVANNSTVNCEKSSTVAGLRNIA